MGYNAHLDLLLHETHDARLGRLIFKMCQKEPLDRMTLSDVLGDEFWKHTSEIRSDFWNMAQRQLESIRMKQISEGLQKLSADELAFMKPPFNLSKEKILEARKTTSRKDVIQ